MKKNEWFNTKMVRIFKYFSRSQSIAVSHGTLNVYSNIERLQILLLMTKSTEANNLTVQCSFYFCYYFGCGSSLISTDKILGEIFTSICICLLYENIGFSGIYCIVFLAHWSNNHSRWIENIRFKMILMRRFFFYSIFARMLNREWQRDAQFT